jgi:tRNA(Ile2)-agmatinylcytidine synthase
MMLKHIMIYNNIGSENIWIGIDDTDSITGGCTTYLGCTIIKKLIDENYDLIGYPRLVRLNPNIPWKTRGNGAISIQLGKGKGNKIKIGEINNEDIFCYQKSLGNYGDSAIKEIVENSVDEYARLDDENTNSGFVLLKEQPSFEIYEKTVKEITNLKEIIRILNESKAYYKGYKNKRGLIGATASIAWIPKKDKTYELIAYRKKVKWGKERFVDDNSTKKTDKTIKTTFDNFDYENKHNRLVPNSPCPILYGIRGENQKDLVKAKSEIKSEEVDSWIIFETNQGTDDHLQKRIINEIQPYQSVITKGTVCIKPYTIKGGHVFFNIKDPSGSIDCAAYEPTKQFRNIIRNLIIGDIVEVYGGVREGPLTINLEKINIKKLRNQTIKIENPVCPKCGKHMKSKGIGQGYKCIKCGIRSKKPLFKKIEREISLGFYEVPVCARRHLSKPLKRIKS